jgi:aminoglycoside phosphotransferase (APT) family kinase protein
MALGLPAVGERPVLVHGDLHVRHLLADPVTGEPSGVIDWGDVCLADPAVDLSLTWSLLDDPGRDAFYAAYGPVPADRRLRARILALFLNAVLALYAHDVGNRALLAEALAGLDRTLTGD